MPAYKVSDGMKKAATDPPYTSLKPALKIVVPATVVMVIIAWSGFFSMATVELGLGHYAEKPLLPIEWLPMPLNTVVNFGYVLCGLYWCFFIAEANRSGIVKCNDAFLFYVFDVMGCTYGFVQLYRIVFQTRASAVLDQWYTLPFFMMVFVWAQTFRGKCSQTTLCVLMLASVGSYLLTFVSTVGFEIALAFHMVLAVTGAVLLYQQCPSEEALHIFIMALLNCAGFVVLKLLDHHLAEFHWVFSYVSGHFLSKICDVLQFHYVNEFFFDMVIGKAVSVGKPKSN